MHQIQFRLWLRPRPRWGAYSAPQTLYLVERAGCPSPRIQPPLSVLWNSPLPSVPGTFSQILAPEHMFRDAGGFPHYDVPYGGLPPPPVAGALPPPAWMPGSGAAANKGQVVINCP